MVGSKEVPPASDKLDLRLSHFHPAHVTLGRVWTLLSLSFLIHKVELFSRSSKIMCGKICHVGAVWGGDKDVMVLLRQATATQQLPLWAESKESGSLASVSPSRTWDTTVKLFNL